MPTLYLVATPIGNLEDITLRALRVLREVSLIAAEDTRTARKLLSHYGIRQRVVSYNEHNMRARTPQLLAALERADVALVSEAGTPSISDPGHELVVAALAGGQAVVPVPGPSALTAALAASGLPTRQFTFLGFLPRRAGQRRRLLASVAATTRTIVVFEAPHRLRETLADMLSAWGDRPVAVCRELTKAFEEVFRGSVAGALAHFQEPRGEFTLVVEGAAPDVGATPSAALRAGFRRPAAAAEAAAREELRRLRAGGLTARDAVAQVVGASGLPRRQVYRLWLETSRPSGGPER